ncbi:spore coat protein U domain-containing protein [Rhodoferax sp.]|uniref:spore coat protein U domain-containing protein n=1 Tax=Rhodoferax sp. TaxID=50421 RepID=UPI0025EBE04C|nr:spore coat protein U domain-containing protein [Rhodoferax sp.]
MKTRNHLAVAAFALGLGMASVGAQAAGSLAGQLNVQMVLQSSCYITGAPGAGATGVNFGALDFGAQPGTFTGVLIASASGGAGGAGATQITCSPDITAISVSVNGGNNAGQGGSVGAGSRAMKLSTSYLPYEVYSDVALTTAYPVNVSSLGVVLPGTGAPVALPVFGRINKTSSSAMTSGTYVDVLQVTLTW